MTSIKRTMWTRAAIGAALTIALPSLFDGVSSRGFVVPIIWNAPGSFSVTLSGGACRAAAATRLPYVAWRPVAS